MINKVAIFLIGTGLTVSCGQTNNNSVNNKTDTIKHEIINDNRISSLKINDSIQSKDFLDTVLYQGGYPPVGLITENLTDAPLIAEGIFLHVDSLSNFGEKVITFQIDTMWKGNISDRVIKFVTVSELSLEEYKKNSYRKMKIVFLKKFEKEKFYDYKDSIEYSPFRDFAIFGLDKNFKDYLLKEYKQIKKLKTKRKE